MKGAKADFEKQVRTMGSSSVREAEPLFPRLHVNRTEKSGPPAPPRNKMALNEQFTLPFHQFNLSNGKALTPCEIQYDQYPNGSLQSGFPYVSTSHDVSFGEKSRKTCRRVCESVSGTLKSANVKNDTLKLSACPNNTSRKISEDAVDNGINDSTLTQHLHKMHVSGKTLMVSTGYQVDVTDLAADSQSETLECKPPESSSFCDEEVDRLADDSQSGKEQLSLPKVECPSLHAITMEMDSSREDIATTTVKSTVPFGDVGMPVKISQKFESSRELLNLRNREVEAKQNTSTAITAALSVKDTKFESEGIVGGVLSQCASGMVICDAGEKVVLLGYSVRPKDVIHVVGQHKFWRARKAMLRQQRMFMDQVFELHKLIKIQQLLAGSVKAMLDEKENKGKLAAGDEVIVEKDVQSGEVRNKLPALGKQIQGQPCGSEPLWNQKSSTVSMWQYHLIPSFSALEVNSWGYPSPGVASKASCMHLPYTLGVGFGQPIGVVPQPVSLGFQRHEVAGGTSELMGLQFAMQQNHYQRLQSSCIGSSASINELECPAYDTRFPWSTENALQQTCMGLQRSIGDEDEESSPPVHVMTTENAKPSGGASKKRGQGVAQRLDLSDSHEVAKNVKLVYGSGLEKPTERRVVECKENKKHAGQQGLGEEFVEASLMPSATHDTALHGQNKDRLADEWQGRVIKVTPWPAIVAPQSAAEILLSLQQKRQQ